MRWSGLLSITMYFYSRPCGRGDQSLSAMCSATNAFLLTPLREGDSNFPQVRHEVLRQIAER